MRNESTANRLCCIDGYFKPFHHYCQLAYGFLDVVPRRQDSYSSMAGSKPVHGIVHLVAQPVGASAQFDEYCLLVDSDMRIR
jgi:hypothetical protein